MSLVGHLGIRARLMILIAVAMLPLGGLAAYLISDASIDRIRHSQADLRRTANMAAAWQAGLFDQARALLEAARENPSVRADDKTACEGAVKALLSGNPQFLTVGLLNSDATIACDTRMHDGSRFADVTLVERVLDPNAPDMVVGDVMIDAVTGEPTIAVAMAIPSVPATVAFASLDLKRLSVMARQVSYDGALAVTMIQPSSDRVLTHYPPIDLPVGAKLEGNALVDVMRAFSQGGMAKAVGPDGIERIYGFAPVRGAEASGIMVAVGEKTAAILGSIRRTAAAAMVLGASIFALALCAAWWVGWTTQILPFSRVARFLLDLEQERDGARVSMEPWQAREMQELCRSLNGTAERLEAARRNDQLVAASEARFRLLAENTADLITLLDENGVRTFASSASRDIVGLEPEQLIGGRPREICHPDDVATVDAMMSTLNAGQAVNGVRYRMAHSDGHHVWVEVGGRSIEGRSGIVMSIRDVTQRKRMEEDLERANLALSALATTDGLTNLMNRRAFDIAFMRELARARRERADLALLFIDVDRFKVFNDTYGHIAGDECLRRVSEAVASQLRRPADIAARYGGEEFAVILPSTAEHGAREHARAILAAVRSLGIANGGSEHGVVTISIGMAVLSATDFANPVDGVEFVSRADRALYMAKAQGRDRVVGWSADRAA